MAENDASSAAADNELEINFDKLKLIKAVHARPILWNNKLGAAYSNRETKKDAWDEVVLLFITNPETASQEERDELRQTLQVKWKSARDCYTKYRKMGKKQKYGAHLSFLDPVLQNIQPLPEESEENAVIKTIKKIKKKKKKKNRSESEDNIDKLFDQPGFGSGVNVASNDSLGGGHLYDADLHFLLSLLPILKAIPESLKLQTRVSMLKLLMRRTSTKNPELPTTLRSSRKKKQEKASSSEEVSDSS